MYAKLFERMGGGGGCSPLTTGGGMQSAYDGGGGGGVQSAYDGGGGGCSPLTTGGRQSAYDGGGGGGRGGCNRQVKLTNSSLTCTHSLLLKTQGTSRQTGPLRTCPVVLHRFVDICPYNRATGTFKYGATRYLLVCRSLSSGRGGAAKAARGRHFIRDGGGGRPPQGYAGSGAGGVAI